MSDGSYCDGWAMDELRKACDDWKQRAEAAEAALLQEKHWSEDLAKQVCEMEESLGFKQDQHGKNGEFVPTMGPWKERIRDLIAKEGELGDLKERAEAAEKACAEMREAFKSFECTICDENHKFRPECNACLSGQPSACTCCNEELVDCPCCMEGEYAEGYRKLRAAIKDGAGHGYLSPAEVLKKVKPLVEALQSSDHVTHRAALAYAEKEGLI